MNQTIQTNFNPTTSPQKKKNWIGICGDDNKSEKPSKDKTQMHQSLNLESMKL